jgi:hypothetical protein
MLLDMVKNVTESGLFPAKYIGVDSAYGSDPKFLDCLPENLIYFAGVRNNHIVFASKSGKHEEVKTLVEKSEEPWEQVVLGIGAKGPIFAEDKLLSVFEARNGLPGKKVWLYARKWGDGTIKYALCNAPSDVCKKEIRKPALMRWSIEQCFKECKDYLGMDHYESRSWDSWHRHVLLTLIAHLFIIKLRIEFSRKPDTPGKTPYITKPVALDEYLDAHMQLLNGHEISHPDIFALPTLPQQFMTIGLVQKLINGTFPKVGRIVEEIDYYLNTAASAFDSHSLSAMDRVTLHQNEAIV